MILFRARRRLLRIGSAEVVAGAEHLAAEGQGEVAVLEVLAGEGGVVDSFLQAVGVVQVVAAEGDEVGAEFHDEFVEGEAAFVGLVGFGGDESFGADVLEVPVEIGGLDFLHEEDAGVFGRGNEFGAEGALVGCVGIGGERTQQEEAEGEGVGGAGDPSDVARDGAG